MRTLLLGGALLVRHLTNKFFSQLRFDNNFFHVVMFWYINVYRYLQYLMSLYTHFSMSPSYALQSNCTNFQEDFIFNDLFFLACDGKTSYVAGVDYGDTADKDELIDMEDCFSLEEYLANNFTEQAGSGVEITDPTDWLAWEIISLLEDLNLEDIVQLDEADFEIIERLGVGIFIDVLVTGGVGTDFSDELAGFNIEMTVLVGDSNPKVITSSDETDSEGTVSSDETDSEVTTSSDETDSEVTTSSDETDSEVTTSSDETDSEATVSSDETGSEATTPSDETDSEATTSSDETDSEATTSSEWLALELIERTFLEALLHILDTKVIEPNKLFLSPGVGFTTLPFEGETQQGNIFHAGGCFFDDGWISPQVLYGNGVSGWGADELVVECAYENFQPIDTEQLIRNSALILPNYVLFDKNLNDYPALDPHRVLFDRVDSRVSTFTLSILPTRDLAIQIWTCVWAAECEGFWCTGIEYYGVDPANSIHVLSFLTFKKSFINVRYDKHTTWFVNEFRWGLLNFLERELLYSKVNCADAAYVMSIIESRRKNVITNNLVSTLPCEGGSDGESTIGLCERGDKFGTLNTIKKSMVYGNTCIGFDFLIGQDLDSDEDVPGFVLESPIRDDVRVVGSFTYWQHIYTHYMFSDRAVWTKTQSAYTLMFCTAERFPVAYLDGALLKGIDCRTWVTCYDVELWLCTGFGYRMRLGCAHGCKCLSDLLNSIRFDNFNPDNPLHDPLCLDGGVTVVVDVVSIYFQDNIVPIDDTVYRLPAMPFTF